MFSISARDETVGTSSAISRPAQIRTTTRRDTNKLFGFMLFPSYFRISLAWRNRTATGRAAVRRRLSAGRAAGPNRVTQAVVDDEVTVVLHDERERCSSGFRPAGPQRASGARHHQVAVGLHRH